MIRDHLKLAHDKATAAKRHSTHTHSANASSSMSGGQADHESAYILSSPIRINLKLKKGHLDQGSGDDVSESRDGRRKKKKKRKKRMKKQGLTLESGGVRLLPPPLPEPKIPEHKDQEDDEEEGSEGDFGEFETAAAAP